MVQGGVGLGWCRGGVVQGGLGLGRCRARVV